MANLLSVNRDLTTKDQWKYVSTGNNPADKASRGMHADAFLRSKLWFNGPDFLCTDESQGPQVTKECLLLDPNGLEVKRVTQANAVTIMDNPINKLIEHFSQWNDLKRGVAWLFKLKDVLKTKLKRKDVDKMVAECHVKTNHLSVEDFARAEQAIVSHVQQQIF